MGVWVPLSHAHTRTRAHKHVHTHVHTRAGTYTRTQTRAHTRAHTPTHAHMYDYAHMCARTHPRTHVHTCKHTRAHVCTTYTHTNVYTRTSMSIHPPRACSSLVLCLQGGGAAVRPAEALPLPAALLRTLASGRVLQSRKPPRLVHTHHYISTQAFILILLGHMSLLFNV